MSRIIKPWGRHLCRVTRLFAVFLLLLPAITARAEQGKSIKESDIIMFLALLIVAFFGWHLLVAAIIFYIGNRRGGGARRKSIWGTYGMSMLGSVVGFAMLRNGPEGHMAVLTFTIVAGIAGGIAGYTISGRVKEKDT